MRAVVAFIAGFFVVVSTATDLRAEQVPKPKGVCGGSAFQEYLRLGGRKAFAYAEDSSGRYTCFSGYGGGGSGDEIQTFALRQCRDLANEQGVDAKCRIVARDDKPLWDETQTARSTNSQSADTNAAVRDEVAQWNRIKNYTEPGYFQIYLERYPNGRFATLARQRLESLGKQETVSATASTATPGRHGEVAHWNRIKDYPHPSFFQAFLGLYPDSVFASLARERIAQLKRQQTDAAKNARATQMWDRIKGGESAASFESFLRAYPGSELAPLARERLAALTNEEAEPAAADTAAPVIDVPARVDTDEAVIDVAGRVADDSAVIELTLNDRAIALGSGGTFRVHRAVPLGTSEVRIAALDEWGNRAEKQVVINRTAVEPELEEAPPAAIEVDPMDEEFVTARNANVRAAPTTDAQKLTTLGAGTTVTVTGRVRGADWYRVERADGGEGYVFASLLADQVEPVVVEAPAQVVQAVLAPPDMDFGRYHALVIGANDYRNLPKLETAVNDASAVADVLRQRYGFTVTLLLNPTRADVVRALDRLRGELTPRDNLLVYYAGHGFLDVEADTGYWQPVDAEEGTRADWIAISGVTSTVKAMSAKHVMVISDSCYSGTLTRGVSVGIKTGAERVAELRRLADTKSRTALVSGGLEPVYDGGGDGHSVFTRALLTALRESTGVLDGTQLFSAIRPAVLLNTPQTPRYSNIREAGHGGGDFLFVPTSTNRPLTEPPAQAAAPNALDMQVWAAIQGSTNPADFETFLETYPASPMAPFARNRLKELAAP